MKFRIKETRTKETKDFDSIFSLFLEEFKIKNEISVENLKTNWISIVGPLLASHSAPVSLNEDILFIKADHPVFSNDLIMIKGDIIKKVNNMFSSSISNVRISAQQKKKLI
ncbi:MAG: DUF721 domain-containing protein [Spirochaetes bacterium]|jgi:hypothetical protein|nr:DUF721 domain-containing protein [Spirochaetota bacterium]